MSRDPTKAKVAKIEALRSASESALLPELRRALCDRSPYLIAKAAAIAGERYMLDLVPDLLTAFDRLMRAGDEADPLAEAKHAALKALKALDCRDAGIYLRGLHHIQLKPAWGPPVDVAAPLRGTCALALAGCDLDDAQLLREFVDYLILDKEKSVRVDVVRAIGEVGGTAAVMLLRLKALAGDVESEVVGECLAALMAREPRESTAFVERFLANADLDVRFEAVCVLGAAREAKAQAAVAAFWNTEMPADMRRALLFSCAASPSPLAAEFLLTIVTDQRRDIAAAAVSALAGSRFRDEYRVRVTTAVEATGDPQVLAAYQKAFKPARSDAADG